MSQNGQTHFKNLAANAVSDHFGTLCIKGLNTPPHLAHDFLKTIAEPIFHLFSIAAHLLNISKYSQNPVNIYLFKVKTRNTRRRLEICSKLTERHQKDIKDVVLVSLLLTLNIFYTFFYCFCWVDFCWLGRTSSC